MVKKIIRKKTEEKSPEEVKEKEMLQTIIALRDEGEFRYYLLNSLLAINESLKKIGQVLIKIGEDQEEGSEDSVEEEEEVEEEENAE